MTSGVAAGAKKAVAKKVVRRDEKRTGRERVMELTSIQRKGVLILF